MFWLGSLQRRRARDLIVLPTRSFPPPWMDTSDNRQIVRFHWNRSFARFITQHPYTQRSRPRWPASESYRTYCVICWVIALLSLPPTPRFLQYIDTWTPLVLEVGMTHNPPISSPHTDKDDKLACMCSPTNFPFIDAGWLERFDSCPWNVLWSRHNYRKLDRTGGGYGSVFISWLC